MTHPDLWRRYTAANPHWLTEGATLTPEGLRKLVETTYEVGRRQGALEGRAEGLGGVIGRLFGR